VEATMERLPIGRTEKEEVDNAVRAIVQHRC
jgi:hypothetical protein